MTTEKIIERILIGILVSMLLVIVFFIWDIMEHRKQRVIIDIDENEMQAMSTDSLHPDPALVWRDGNNIPHLSYNYSK